MAVVAPMATWKPFSGKSTRALTHDIICAHTMVGTLAGSWSWANQSGNPYWHFGLGGNGALWQCVDLNYRSAANLDGNWHIIPIETSDTKEGIFPAWSGSNVPAWTTAQINKLVELIAWLCKKYNIPPVLVPDTKPGRRGLAYHRQGIDPWRVSGGEKWSNATGKVCPGDRRVSQFTNIVVPRVQALLKGQVPVNGEEEDMPHLTVITGPGKPSRVYVDGALMGFANGTELNETIAPYVKAGYKRYNVAFAEADDWQRYMTSVRTVDVSLPTAAQIAAAVVAALPAGSVDGAVVTEAVKTALREGTS